MKKLFLLLLLMSLGTYAQQVDLYGSITNDTNEPVAGATVYAVEANKGTVSNIDGHYRLALTPGKYTIKVSSLGYKTIKSSVQLNQNLKYDFFLDSDSTSLDEVIVTAVRAGKNTPVAQTNLGQKTLQEKNLAQDVPYLLDQTPSVVTTSDAGAGVGYTGIRIRGISPQQINVTLNGVPLNDPESHGVYWVDIPDFVSSTSSLQVQRGVGTSTFGTGAFGASISLETDKISPQPYTQISSTYGTFNTQKYSVKGSTGLLRKHFEFTARFSKITSDGYVDRASSDLQSYYISGSYKDEKNTLKAIVFGGAEVTYQSWNGIDKETFENNPTFNSAGAIYNDAWEVAGYYDNEVDDYKQDHYQLHYKHKVAQNFSFNVAAHYTYGRGYYEQYKQDRDFADYGLTPITINGTTIENTDLIRRKWLDNDFYGLTASVLYKADRMKLTLGFAGNEYDGRHFGRVIWARYASDSEIRHEYYNNTGVKKTYSGFAKSMYDISDKLKLYTDIQFRSISYKIDGTLDYNYDYNTKDDLFFVNPKIGLFYEMNQQNSFYASIAQTHREPNRDDYINNIDKPKAETLNDIEAGWKYKSKKIFVETNLYAMMYQDQLVLSGKIDNVGSPIRENVGKSNRLGIETQLGYKLNKILSVNTNLTISSNKNDNYIVTENGALKNYGNTNLTYSPGIIAGGSLNLMPVDGLKLQLISKYVGEQYMDNRNIEASKLDAYFIENAFVSYQIKPKNYFKNIQFSLQVNNLFNKKYASNGYMWGDSPYYYPQAGTHYLLGMMLGF